MHVSFGGMALDPLVIGPSGVPEIVDDNQAQADPELAVLSAMAHGNDRDVSKSVRIAAAAQRICRGLDTERARLYFDLIHHSLSEAARRALREMLPANYEYQSDFARKYYGQGKSEGRVEGSRETLTNVIVKQLSLRFGALDETALSRIAAASSTELEQVAERLLTASTLEDALSPAGNGARVRV